MILNYRRGSRFATLLEATAALLLLGVGLTAARAEPADPPRVEQDGCDYRIPLGWLNSRNPQPLELYGADSRLTLKLPVPARLAIDEKALEMVYTNSIALNERSQLAVALDRRVMAQLPVTPGHPDHAARIDLSSATLAPGYHDLDLRAAQHYTDECENPAAPELYSQVDAMESALLLTARRHALAPSLARLGDVFDQRLWLNDYRLQLLVPPGALAGDEALRRAASQVSQFIAGKFEYLPVSVDITELGAGSEPNPGDWRQFPGLELPDAAWDAVLLGTREQLAPYVAASALERIKEGYIGIHPADRDPTRFILLVSGTTPDEVRQAATALALPGLVLPDNESVSLSELSMDSGYRRASPTQSERGWTRFAELGFRTTSLKGMYPGAARLEFWSIREALDPARPYVEMQLSYAYGSGFDQKSALNVTLNGQFVQALPLQNITGEQVHRAKVRIPTVALRAGVNEVRFEPSVIGVDVGGACKPIFTENLRVSILEDSRIELPPMADYMRLPDLGLMAQTGLPYTRSVDGDGVAVVAGDMQADTLESAFTLVAKLRQNNRAPLSALRFPRPDDALDGFGGLIVVGGQDTLPKGIAGEMNAFMPGLKWQTLQVGSYPTRDLGNGVRRWVEQPTTPLARLTEVDRPATARVAMSEGLGSSAAMVQFRSGNDQPVTVLTAADTHHLSESVRRLVGHDVWSTVAGSAFLWSKDGGALASANAPDAFFVGERPAVSPVSYLMSANPWTATALVVLFILLGVALIWRLLRRRARRLGAED